LSKWKKTLNKIVQWAPEHISLYALTIECGTNLERMIADGAIQKPEDDLAADMYELACEVLNRAGYVHYEISNWAKSENLFCQHNLTYWRDEPYFGFGLGAHGYIDDIRYSNISKLDEYISAMRIDNNFEKIQEQENFIDAEEAMREWMMLRLRLLQEGASKNEFINRFKKELLEVFTNEVKKCMQLGLIEEVGKKKEIIRLTKKGMPVANQVFYRFMKDQ
jgi:oxygen-independent coproporphyrinogen-3 oxidase